VSVLHPADAMREGIFTAASIVTTTGFDVRYAGMQVLPLALVLMIVFVGGGTMSTAGGIKLYRVGIMAVQSMRELDRTIYPHAVRSSYVGSVLYDIQLMKSIWTLLIATSALIGVAAGIISMFGLDPVQSLTLAM
jgi:trk system potassium uptake protein TrkH